MSEVIIKRRYTDLAFYGPKAGSAFLVKRNELMSLFGREMRQAATFANIPLAVLQSIVLIENIDLNPLLVNSAGFIGLGQVSTSTASDVIIREKRKKRLSDNEIQVLRKQLGNRTDLLFKADIDQKKAGNQGINLGYDLVKVSDLKNAEFNLMITAMFTSQIIDEELETTIEGELVRLDRVIVRYNQGYYYKFLKGTTNAIIAQLPTEPRNYIKKMVGANGMMEVLT